MANTAYGTDGLMATTLKHYIKTLEDNIFNSAVLLWILKTAGRVINIQGGTHIVQPLLYAGSANKGSYAGNDTFTTAANTGISAAEFPWRQFYGLFSIEGIERAKNLGAPAIIKLLEARLKQLEMTISEEMEAMLFGDGSGNAQKDFYGLAAIIDSSNPPWGNFGGIDRTNYAYWRATETALGGALTLTAMSKLYNDVSNGKDQPTNILTTQLLYEKYEALLQTNLRHEDTKMGDAGFQNLMFKGAPMAFSDNVTAGEMLAMNVKYITLNTLSGVWFKPSELAQPTNQDVFYKHLLCYGNLVASNCARQGKLTGATA